MRKTMSAEHLFWKTLSSPVPICLWFRFRVSSVPLVLTFFTHAMIFSLLANEPYRFGTVVAHTLSTRTTVMSSKCLGKWSMTKMTHIIFQKSDRLTTVMLLCLSLRFYDFLFFLKKKIRFTLFSLTFLDMMSDPPEIRRV